MGVSNAFVATGLYAVIPDLARDPRKIGLGMACLALFQNLGIFCGSTFFGIMQAGMGWNAADLALLLPVSIFAFIMAVIIKMPSKKAGENGLSEKDGAAA